MNNLPKVVTREREAGSRTRDLQSRKSIALIITPPGHTTTLCRFVIWRGAGVHSVACEVVLTCEFCAISVLLLLLLLHPFNGLFSRTTWVNRFQKGKTSIDLNEARVDGVLG